MYTKYRGGSLCTTFINVVQSIKQVVLVGLFVICREFAAPVPEIISSLPVLSFCHPLIVFVF